MATGKDIIGARSQVVETTLKCYRGACTHNAHPKGFHRITHGLYCERCVEKIEGERERFNPEWDPFFPYFKLQVDTDESGGSYADGIIRVRVDRKLYA